MINTFQTELGQSVKMTELYDYLELEKTHYSRFVKKELLNSIYFEINKDYFPLMANNTITGKRGQFRQEINIHIDCAKKICMISKSKKGNEIRDELIKLTKQVENAGLVTHKQVLEIVKMIKIFSIYEYRRLALNKNCENYINNAIINEPNQNRKYLYAQFHNWRNEVLQTGKETLEQRVKEYCLIEHKRIPAKFTQDEALTLMGEYEQIKNAIWDLLSSQNKSEEMINNICNLAQDLAKEIKPFLQRLNESNLFFTKIDNAEVKQALIPLI